MGTIALGFVIHILHEAAHALTAVVFGVSGLMRPNTVSYGPEMTPEIAIWTTAAGPALMLLFALIAARLDWRWSASVIFITFAQRAMAAVISMITSPNDEARLGEMLGVGPWPFFSLSVSLTFALFVYRYRRDGLDWKWVAISYAGFSIALATVVLGNKALFHISF